LRAANLTTFRLTLEYDGTAFEGWQVQPGGRRTVQGSLEDALAQVTGRRVRVAGSGRTDAGVHARGQVASVRLETRLDAAGLRRALNGVLPADVAVVGAAPAPEGFHARRDARSKLYGYRIWNGADPSPLRARFSHWVPAALDLEAMVRAAGTCRGRHDFAAFQAAGSNVETTVRTLSRFDVTGESRGEISILVEGDGFLRHMVRNLAGTLVDVGLGRRDSDSMVALLAARDRRRAGRTAPAAGLTLLRVAY
jgi:tRNA pseudouridine38-40 synthase